MKIKLNLKSKQSGIIPRVSAVYTGLFYILPVYLGALGESAALETQHALLTRSSLSLNAIKMTVTVYASNINEMLENTYLVQSSKKTYTTTRKRN